MADSHPGAGPDGEITRPLFPPTEPEAGPYIDDHGTLLPPDEHTAIDLDEVDEFDEADDVDEVDADLLPAGSRGPMTRMTALLGVAVVAAAAFGAGVAVQKHHDAALTSATTGAQAAGFGGGGFRGQGGQGGGFGGGRQNGGQGGGAGAGAVGAGAATTPVVVGQVVSVRGNTLVVRNFGGRTITVTIPEGTTVTRSTTVGLKDLKAGTSVAVQGSTGADGTVTATSVTAR
jgi:hypothetical protein